MTGYFGHCVCISYVFPFFEDKEFLIMNKEALRNGAIACAATMAAYLLGTYLMTTVSGGTFAPDWTLCLGSGASIAFATYWGTTIRTNSSDSKDTSTDESEG